MSNTKDSAVEVTPADMAAAEAFWQEFGPFAMGTVRNMAERFARHRLASMPAATEGEAFVWMLEHEETGQPYWDENMCVWDGPHDAEDAAEFNPGYRAVALYTHPATTDQDKLIADLVAGLQCLEAANEALCKVRSQAVYNQMMADCCAGELSDLDDARSNARALLTRARAQGGDA